MMIGLHVLALLCAAVLAVNAVDPRRYDGYQLLRVYPRDQAQAEFVYEQQSDDEIDFWYEGKDRFDILVPPHKLESFKYQMTQRNVPFMVENSNIQRGIDEELYRRATKLPQPEGMPVDYDDYNLYPDIMQELDNLAARCPTGVSCETFVVGLSHEGREIKGLRIFGSGSGRKGVWLDATIHAREWLSTATHLKIVKHLIDDSSDPQVAALLQAYDWWLVPVSNPDGYVYTQTDRLWRKNRRPNAGSSCVGTDLNRNYNQMWGNAGASTSFCSETYRGSSAASEVETQVVQAALLSRGASLLVSIHFHTYGHLWLMPWGSTNTDGSCNYANDDAEMLVVANAAADAVQRTWNEAVWKRGNSCATIYPASGITMDYSKGVAGVKYTFTPELRGNSFVVPAVQIQPSFVEVWNGLTATIAAIEAAAQ